MKTKVVITVDTEPSIAGAFADPERCVPLLHEPVAGIVNSRSEALGFLIRTMTEYGLRATFFVETMHTRYFSDAPMGAYVDTLMAAGHDVQLHLHPCWLAFRDGKSQTEARHTDNCSDIERPRLAELIGEGRDQIRSWTGSAPTGMRTGNFATAMNVFEAMHDAALEHSSNICLAMHRPPEEPLAVTGGAHNFSGIRELPVTCFSDIGPVGRGRLRPMQVTALSATEQTGLLEQIHAKNGAVAVIVTHPFEYVKKRDAQYHGMRANRIVQRRFDTLCAFLAANRARFDVVSLADAAATLGDGSPMQPLVGDPVRASARAAVQFLSDHIL